MVTQLAPITVQGSGLEAKSLESLWDGLSSHLIASFYEVAKTGQDGNGNWGRIEGERGTDPDVVRAPLIDANLEILLNWQSPFESAGPESRAPGAMAMLQSGALQPVLASMDLFRSKRDGPSGEEMAGMMDKTDSFLKQFEGRTGITKLNSTQVFSGMPPIKITCTALFRAWADAAKEVEAPFNRLMEWALPVQLSKDASILARAVQAVRGNMDFVSALMPSKSPTRIAMSYKGRVISPLVIESIGMPLSSPVNSDGRFVELAVPLTLCSLTAIDRGDWQDYGGQRYAW